MSAFRALLPVSGAPPRNIGLLFLLTSLLLLPSTVTSIAAQNFRVLHTFTGGAKGGSPVAGLILDAQGNLYAATGEKGIVFISLL